MKMKSKIMSKTKTAHCKVIQIRTLCSSVTSVVKRTGTERSTSNIQRSTAKNQKRRTKNNESSSIRFIRGKLCGFGEAESRAKRINETEADQPRTGNREQRTGNNKKLTPLLRMQVEAMGGGGGDDVGVDLVLDGLTGLADGVFHGVG